jgi:hypothetical protein
MSTGTSPEQDIIMHDSPPAFRQSEVTVQTAGAEAGFFLTYTVYVKMSFFDILFQVQKIRK